MSLFVFYFLFAFLGHGCRDRLFKASNNLRQRGPQFPLFFFNDTGRCFYSYDFDVDVLNVSKLDGIYLVDFLLVIF